LATWIHILLLIWIREGPLQAVGDCAMSWRATLQPIIVQSIAEAEYMAIAEACKDSVWLKGLYAELCSDDSYVNLFMTVKVLYILLNIKCSMRGVSTLMSSTIM
jgi:hypothetical protein